MHSTSTRMIDAQVSTEMTALVEGLNLQMAEAFLVLDRPVPVRHLCTATIRGMLGYALAPRHSQTYRRCFKPLPHPPAFALQPLARTTAISREVPFRIVSWDPEGGFVAHALEALRDFAGARYGEGRARLVRLFADRPRKLHVARSTDFACQKIRLRTPLQIKHQKRILRAVDFTPDLFLSAAIRRVNLLSTLYGNGQVIKLSPAQEPAGQGIHFFLEKARIQVHDIQAFRRSRRQQCDVHLRGIVGNIRWPENCGPLSDLLALASVFGVGRHTSSGCGCIQVLIES